jgi:hypothetical protein
LRDIFLYRALQRKTEGLHALCVMYNQTKS